MPPPRKPREPSEYDVGREDGRAEVIAEILSMGHGSKAFVILRRLHARWPNAFRLANEIPIPPGHSKGWRYRGPPDVFKKH